MKKYIGAFVLVILSGLTTFAGTINPEVTYFNQVRFLGNYKVLLQKGTTQKVEIKNNDASLLDEKIVCEVEDSVMTIRIKGDTYKAKMMEVVVTYTDLNEISAKFGCEVTANDVFTNDITFNSESGGKIKAAVDCANVTATINASGSIHLNGTTKNAVYKVGAGGTIGAIDLAATKVFAQVSAGGEIICAVIDDLSIKITSGGNVSYYGNPEAYEQNIALGGKITKMKKPEEIIAK